MATNIDYEKENQYLPQNIRQFIANADKIHVQSYDMFFSLFSDYVKYPLYNNWMAAKFSSGWTVLNHSSLQSGIAPRLLNIKVSKICGKVYYQAPKESEEDVAAKLPKEYLSRKLYEAFDKSARTGRALMTLYNDQNKEEAYIEVFDAFRHDLVFNNKKEIVEAKMFIAKLDGINTSNDNYYIVEKRFYKNDLPYQTIKVQYQTYTNVSRDKVERSIELEDKDIPSWLQEKYQDIRFNKEVQLEGFSDLGVYHIDETATNSKFPDSDIPQAMFVDALDELVSIENSLTAKEVEKTLGRGQVLLPTFGKEYIPPMTTSIGSSARNLVAPAMLGNQAFKNPIISQYPSKSMEDCKPTPVQFDFRPDQWEITLNADIERLCALVGLSILDYNPKLIGSNNRTDDEINCMTDITALTVQTARNLNELEINKMLACVSSIYGLPKPVSIRWSMASILNPTKNSYLVSQQLAAGLLSRKEAIKRLNPDLSDSEIDDLYNEIMKEIQATNKDVVIDEFNNF